MIWHKGDARNSAIGFINFVRIWSAPVEQSFLRDFIAFKTSLLVTGFREKLLSWHYGPSTVSNKSSIFDGEHSRILSAVLLKCLLRSLTLAFIC